MPEPIQEKRLGKRLPIKLVVAGRSRDGGEFEEIGQTRDVSAGGVFFYTSTDVMPNSPIDLLMPLPPQLADRLVRRRRFYETGGLLAARIESDVSETSHGGAE